MLHFPRGGTIHGHAHRWDQLVLAAEGTMTVETAEGRWVAPSHRALWVPAGVDHEIRMRGATALGSLYFGPGRVRSLPRRCCVVQVSPLLRELIVHVGELAQIDESRPDHRRLVGVLLDRLAHVDQEPLALRWPRDARAVRAAGTIEQQPSDRRTLDEIARGVGASKRTLERLFVEQTGMTLGRWRQRARLLAALRELASGRSVGEVATAVGYATPSAFVAMFRESLGTTPHRYFKEAPARG
ncbi:MAG: helix-turn-helix transcriptional regulator [Myxococcota bacterium]